MAAKYYLTFDVMKDIYKDIVEKPVEESSVKIFWLKLLFDYFPKKENFCIVLVHTHGAQFSYHAIELLSLQENQPSTKATKGIFLHDEDREEKYDWEWAVEKLTQIMVQRRTEERLDGQAMFGVVSIGRYNKFYQLNSREEKCVAYPRTEGRCYEIAADEEELHLLLVGLADKCRDLRVKVRE
ncbi:hypothetical protein HYALB_00013717 [Hymenoscyphus albidus]|uniref:Uncharacterized protein n=1 Tax=Hymenoscyphus albidus TaxID=595503 RepID=A0A9N9Q5C5_9HELO|nr:hypothetical protein HYALB_00013717 [Hymenoscyphus albidus]